MGIWDFLSIYWRNVKGVFLGGFVAPIFDLAAVVWICHIALLPISLTLVAGLKTVIDFFTRKDYVVPQDRLNQRKDEIKNFTQEQMDSLVKEISDYQPMSNSSYKLVEELDKPLSKKTKKTIEEKCEVKKAQLLKQQDDQLKHINPDFAGTGLARLEPNRETALSNYRTKLESQLHRQKSLIQDYMEQDSNQGKRMLRIIVGMFKPSAKKVLETKVKTHSNELH